VAGARHVSRRGSRATPTMAAEIGYPVKADRLAASRCGGRASGPSVMGAAWREGRGEWGKGWGVGGGGGVDQGKWGGGRGGGVVGCGGSFVFCFLFFLFFHYFLHFSLFCFSSFFFFFFSFFGEEGGRGGPCCFDVCLCFWGLFVFSIFFFFFVFFFFLFDTHFFCCFCFEDSCWHPRSHPSLPFALRGTDCHQAASVGGA